MSRLILWDFDGTLYHSDESYKEYMLNVYRMSGSVNKEFLAKTEDALSGKGEYIGEDGWSIVAQISRRQGMAEHLNKAFQMTREKMNEGLLKIYPNIEAINILSKTKAINVLATNTPKRYAVPVLRQLGILGFFKKIIYGAKKPTGIGSIVEELSLEYSLKYEDMLSIGDNYVNDIEPCINLGIKTLYISNFGRESSATLTVKKLSEAVEFIKEFVGDS